MIVEFRIGLFVFGNILMALSAFFSVGAYSSGDSSGMQYVSLMPARAFAAVAFVLASGLLISLRFRMREAWTNFTLALAALSLSFLGYGRLIDWMGTIVGACLLIVVIPHAIWAAQCCGGVPRGND